MATALPPKLPPCGFLVSGGKKGNIPLSIEKRPKGKKVTVLSNVQGSAKSLLSALSSLLGVGGTLRQEASGQHWTIEVQGDQVERVGAALEQLGCLKGVKREQDKPKKKAETEVAARNCGYDKFLRRGDIDRGSAAEAAAAASRSEIMMLHSDCAKWHGPWAYCRGSCHRPDMSDVWDDGGLTDEGGQRAAAAAPAPVSSLPELNLLLRGLGMLPEVGAALRVPAANPQRGGASLADYRGAAVAPGARLITDEPQASRPSKDSRSKSVGARPRPPPSKPIKLPPPPKVGTFSCALCGCAFGLSRTLKLHMRNVHQGGAGAGPAAVSMLTPLTTPAPVAPRPLQRPWSRGAATEKPAASAKSVGDSSTAKSPKPQAEVPVAGHLKEWPKSPCPICGKLFCAEVVEAHVDACLAETSQQPPSSRSASPEPACGEAQVQRVLENFEPTGEGRETQLRLRQGQRVVVQWWQPASQGAYWAWGSPEDAPQRSGYFPQGILAAVEDKPAQRAATPESDEGASRKRELEESGALPEVWLESFLLLGLPAHEAEAFWHRFEQLRRSGLCMDSAWFTALSAVHDPVDLAARRQTKPRSKPHAPVTARAVQEKVAQVKATGVVAVSDWDPSGQVGADTQIPVHVGDRLVIEWRQPQGDGGFWAYGHLVGKPDRKGYFPAKCIAPPAATDATQPRAAIASAEPQQAVPAKSQQAKPQQAEPQQAEPQQAKPQRAEPQQAKPQQAKPQRAEPQQTEPRRRNRWDQGSKGEQEPALGVAARAETATKPSASAGRSSKPAATAKGRAGRREGPVDLEESHAVCPLCSEAVPFEDLERHCSSCPGRSSTAFGEAVPPEPDPGLEAWALAQLTQLIRRFCVGPLDESVALAALSACLDAGEVREQAVVLIADNQPVRNFAAEFSRRRGGTAVRSARAC